MPAKPHDFILQKQLSAFEALQAFGVGHVLGVFVFELRFEPGVVRSQRDQPA